MLNEMKKRRRKRQKRGWVVSTLAIGLCGVLVAGGVMWKAGSFAKPVVQPAEAAANTPTVLPPKRPLPIAAEYERFVPEGTAVANRDDNLPQRDLNAQYRSYLDSLPAQHGEVIATYKTSLAGNDAEGRVKNIQLANSKLNGMLLLPGEELSFNGALGDSNDPSAGWQLATVIVGKKFEQGYGGGICQVSSTLYNAVKQAGLAITERHTHSLPVGYVLPGNDATVSFPELDLKFVNSLGAPVRVEAKIAGGQVITSLHRLPEFNYEQK